MPAGLRAQAVRSVVAAGGVAWLLVILELLLVVPSADLGDVSVIRLCAVGIGLAGFGAFIAMLVGGTLIGVHGVGCRVVRSVYAPHGGANTAVWIHGGGVFALMFVIGAATLVYALILRFVQPGLIALVAAVACLVWGSVCAGFGLAVVGWLSGRRILPAVLGQWDPFVCAKNAVLVWIGVFWIGAGIAYATWTRFQIVFPLRPLATLTLGVLLWMERDTLLRLVFCPRGQWRRAAIVVAGLALIVGVCGVFWVADAASRRAVLLSPSLSLLVKTLRTVSDLDRDGYSSLLGEGDCAPFDRLIHPGAQDVANDGIDQNCTGADYVPVPRPSPVSEIPVPDHLRRNDWSVLLITIDTLRYDRVGFGGYSRPTTPALDRLAKKSVWFDNAYSTGVFTKDVLPTIATSQYAEELPLGDRIAAPKQYPRKLLPSAITFAEVLQSSGYQTAFMVAHPYFDGWGIDQGFDVFHNVPWKGASNPTASVLTQRAIQWLDGVESSQRWFLWVHYYDPHFPYVGHPKPAWFGDTHSDRYDGEVRFVDESIGRLLKSVSNDPDQKKRTIVIVTADHGEQLGERGSYGHGGALWQYLVHVPLLMYVPGISARRMKTPVSLLDLAPTLAALVGVAPDPSWTGRALIPELVLGRESPDRVVFSAEPETRTYAAISLEWKLIFSEYENLYQLVHLPTDSKEKRNATDPRAFAKLKRSLVQWRERLLGDEVAR